MSGTSALEARIAAYSAGLQPSPPITDPVVLSSELKLKLDYKLSIQDFSILAGYVSLGNYSNVKPNDQSYANANTLALKTILSDESIKNIYIPPGVWYFNYGFNISRSTPLNILGSAVTNTVLAWINTNSLNTGGLYINQTNPLSAITIKNLSFACDSTTGSGTALTIVFPYTASGTFPTVSLDEIHTLGLDIFNNTWKQGIALSNCWNARLRNLHINGALASGKTQLMQLAIGCVNCTGISISRFKIYNSFEGIIIGGGPSNVDTIDEGFIVTDFEIVGVNRGFYHATRNAHAGNLLANGHINADRIAVQLYAKHKCQLSNLYLYKLTNSNFAWNGIVLQNCDSNQINDIQFSLSGGTSGGAVGILMSGSSHNIIHDIKTDEAISETFNGIVIIQDTCSDNYVHHIKSYGGSSTTPVICTSTSQTNYFDNITPNAHATLAINSSIPSIGNDIYGKWITANTQATTITNFIDGLDARTFQLLINDTFTTIQHNAGLILKNGTTVTVPNSGIMTFGKYNNVWRELNRSF